MIRLIYSVVLLLAALSFGMTSVPCSAKAIHLSADSLFKIIDERSRMLRLASLYAAEASEGVAVARSRRLPVVSASLSVGYLGNGYLTARDFSGGMGIHNPHSNNNFALEAAQVVYDGGAISGGIRLATLKERMSRLDVEQSRRQVRFMLLGWLTDLQCLHNRRRVLDENIALARQVVADMKARYDNGVVLGSDIMRYELYLEELELQREKLCEKLRTTNYRLANALGFPTGDTEFVPGLPADSTWTAGTEQSWHETAAMSSLTLRKAALAIDLSETGQPLADIVDSSEKWVVANYRETQLRHISEGMKVDICVDAMPGSKLTGVVKSISYSTGSAVSALPADNAAGNFVKVEQRVPMRIVLDGNNPEALRRLRAGMSVECEVKY